jgi:hypothetical protein
VLESIKSILNFVYVQALEEKHRETLYRLLHASLTSELSGRVYRNQVHSDYLQARIQSTACISLHCSSNEIRNLIGIATHLYNDCLSRKGQYQHLFDSINTLFKSIAYVLLDVEILELMPEFLAIPLPENSRPNEFDSLKDIFFYIDIDFSTIKSVPDEMDISIWEPHIEHLIFVAKNGESLARCRAIRRLTVLCYLNALSEPQKSSFAEALWSRVDELTHFPKDTPLNKCGFLMLPELTIGQAKQIFKQYLMTSDLPTLYSDITFGTSGLDDHLFLDYLRGSWDITKNENKDTYIDWSESEAIKILNKFSSWWYREKENLLDPRNQILPIIGDTINRSIWHYLQVLATIVLPRIPEYEEELQEKIGRLIADINSSGFCVLPILPMTLFYDPEKTDEVAQRLRIALASIEEEEVKKSIWSLLDWLLYSEYHTLPKPPTHLLDDLVSRILTRSSPMLNCALSTMSSIVYRVPHTLTEKHLINLCAGLNFLLQETRIPILAEMESDQNRNALIAMEDRPEYREHASRLAFYLYRYCIEHNQAIPSTLVSWRKASRSDSLPSVRKIWQGVEQPDILLSAHPEQEQRIETLRDQIITGTEQIQQGKVVDGEATFDRLQAKISQMSHPET